MANLRRVVRSCGRAYIRRMAMVTVHRSPVINIMRHWAWGRNDETYGETHGTFVAEVNTYGAAKLWVVNVVLRSQSPSTWRLSEAPL